MMSRFQVMPLFWNSAPNDPKWLYMFKVKNTDMHTTETLKAHIFIHFALWWAIFELCPFFGKSAPNDTKWPWHVQDQNTNTHAKYTPKLSSVSLYMSHSQVTHLFFWKSSVNNPKRPWCVQGKQEAQVSWHSAWSLASSKNAWMYKHYCMNAVMYKLSSTKIPEYLSQK